MTSAATEREMNKWQLWGVNKFLQANAALQLKQEKDDEPPSIDLVEHTYFHGAQEALDLIEEARSSLKDMDIRWVILGACHLVDCFPLRTSTGRADRSITESDVFRTFGKNDTQGGKILVEASGSYLRFQEIRKLNNMPLLDFAAHYMDAKLMNYEPSPRSITEMPQSSTEKPSTIFDLGMIKGCHLYENFTQEIADINGLSLDTPQTLFQLIKHTSYEDYKASSQGWDDDRKLEEMKDEDMHYLIVRLKGHEPPAAEKRWSEDPGVDHSIIGFISYMITQEEEENVIYIYEVHISDHFRDCGLGGHLFKTVEHLGKATGMEKAMLTVFRTNTHARKWYVSRGYDVDEISPRPRKLRGGRSIQPDYEILSKRLEGQSIKKAKS